MNILVACEESQVVTIELRRLGHRAFSCDLIECSGGHPEWHIMQDVLPLVNGRCSFHTMDGKMHTVDGRWDMIIAFPPCTHLAVSGAKHFSKKRADGRQQRAIEFFCAFLLADCDRIAIENPVGIISGDYIPKHFPEIAKTYGLPRKPDQIVQPWQFGDPFEKTTCLWLINVPILVPTKEVTPEPRHITSGGNSLPAWYSNTRIRMSGNRQTVRSKTFPGLGLAMAEQWAGPAEVKA